MNAQAQPQLTIIDLLDGTRYEIFDGIVSGLNIQDITRLSRTSKKLRECMKLLYSTKWNINARLSRYFQNPLAFRSLQAKHNAIISGSFTTQFFTRQMWPKARFHFYVSQGPAVAEFEEYLVKVEGYKPLQGASNDTGTTFGKHTSKDLYVRLTKVASTAHEYLLKQSSHTAVLNFISWNKAFSIFPHASFVEYKTYQLHDLNDRTGDKLAFASRNGWETADTTSASGRVRDRELTGTRRIGDRKSCVILLDTLGVQPPNKPGLQLDLCEFESEVVEQPWIHRQVSLQRLSITFEPFKSVLLQHGYTRSTSFDTSFYTSFARSQLARLALIEYYKIPREKRPEVGNLDLMQWSGEQPDGFQVPVGWPYKDRELARWLEEWDQLGEDEKPDTEF